MSEGPIASPLVLKKPAKLCTRKPGVVLLGARAENHRWPSRSIQENPSPKWDFYSAKVLGYLQHNAFPVPKSVCFPLSLTKSSVESESWLRDAASLVGGP